MKQKNENVLTIKSDRILCRNEKICMCACTAYCNLWLEILQICNLFLRNKQFLSENLHSLTHSSKQYSKCIAITCNHLQSPAIICTPLNQGLQKKNKNTMMICSTRRRFWLYPFFSNNLFTINKHAMLGLIFKIFIF